MFSTYISPFNWDWEDVHIEVREENGFWIYSRNSGQRSVSRYLTGPLPISLQPVEPLNTPKDLTHLLMIQWPVPLSVAPKDRIDIVLNFPLEIGVSVHAGEKRELIDVLSLNKGKFTLYGDPRSGLICKYWESEILDRKNFSPDPKSGALYLDIANESSDWIEVSKAVFNAFGMKLFYGPEIAVLHGTMSLLSPTTAVTDFRDKSPIKNLNRSFDVFPAKRILAGTPKFVMREGL